MNTEVRTDLLMNLADHLLSGKLGHEKFDFSKYNYNHKAVYDHESQPDSYTCGTAGCAMGEMPILFPKEWCFGRNALPVLVSVKDHVNFCASLTENCGMSFFGISEEEYKHLFIPHSQLDIEGGFDLCYDATAEDVALNIKHFCSLKEKGEL